MSEDGDEWKRQVRWTVLDKRVIAVAMEGSIRDWAAYIGAVPGNNHNEEWLSVYENGSKLPRKVAEVLFPDFKCLEWRE